MEIVIIIFAIIIFCSKAEDRRCFTPDGMMGTCKRMQSCPSLKLLYQGHPQHFNFIKMSRCEGLLNVCCKSPFYFIASIQLTSEDCQKYVAPPDPRSECCGVETLIEDKIYYGGDETAIDQYPWMALIEYENLSSGNISLSCGGSLISSKYVLTARHCVADDILDELKPINIRLGEYDTSSDGSDCVEVVGGGEDCTEGTTVIPIAKVIVHQNDDIALIRMTNHAPYTDFIRPICLPTFDIVEEARLNNDLTLYVAGWGAVNETQMFSNIKRHVDVPYVKCHEKSDYYSTSHIICAGGVLGKDSCLGDSGGPLMYNRYGIYSVVGVVSNGPNPCGQEKNPAYYTNVYQYLPWIRSQMKP